MNNKKSSETASIITHITGITAFILTFFAAITVLACDSSTFNFFELYKGATYKANISSFKSLEDSIQKFCVFSGTALIQQSLKSGGSEEIRVILKDPVVLDEENFKLDDRTKKEYIDSIETSIRSHYSPQKITLCGRDETKKIFEAIGQTDENFLMTPEISKTLHDKYNIYAFLNIALAEMNSWNGYSFNLMGYSDDRRDIEYRNYVRVNIRYKLTECKNGNILWIDEVPGIAEDIFFLTFFEKARALFLKKECTNFSVISESSCIQPEPEIKK